MRTRTLLAAAGLAASAGVMTGLAPVQIATRAPAAAAATPATFAVDAAHSCALFRVQHLGAGMFWGRFNTISGTFTLDEAATSNPVAFDIAIDIKSIDTGVGNLDQHLQNADFFDAENHAAMTFKSTASKLMRPSMYEVKGDLTMRGTTKPIVAMVEWTGTRAGQRGTRAGAEAIFTVKRSDYGIMYGVENGALGDETRIIVGLEGILTEGTVAAKPPADAAASGTPLPGRWAQQDKNGDGKLQKDEVPEGMLRRWDILDTNGDGAIDGDELIAIRGGRGDRNNRGGGQPGRGLGSGGGGGAGGGTGGGAGGTGGGGG